MMRGYREEEEISSKGELLVWKQHLKKSIPKKRFRCFD